MTARQHRAFLARRLAGVGRRGFKSAAMVTKARLQTWRRPSRNIFRRMPRTFSIEKKFHDLDIDDASIAANWTVQAGINLIPQGVTEITRVGRKATIKDINWRFTITWAGGNVITATTVRVLMVLDKQCNGALPSATDILETDDFQSFNNLANKSRFRTLMDRTYDINPAGAAGDGTANDGGENKTSDSFFKKCSIPIEFDSTAGAITEIRSNNIVVLLASEVANLAVFSSKIRLRFTDL